MKTEKKRSAVAALLRRTFAKNTDCAICGKPTGKNRYQVGKRNDGVLVWLCFHCATRNYRNQLRVDPATGEVEVLSTGKAPAKAEAPSERFEVPESHPAPQSARPVPAAADAPIRVEVPEDTDDGENENLSGSPMLLADEVQKYKDKLDQGTITEEEFQALKRKLLGL